jgi:nucleotide-binding universal stress UspA family protein
MSQNIVTLTLLSFEKAQVLKNLLEERGIECFLQNVNLIQGAVSTGVKVRIKEADLADALKVLEGMIEANESDDKDTDAEEIPRILVPVDFSDYSNKALAIAFDWAGLLDAELTVMHSYYYPMANTIPFSDAFVYDLNTEDMVVEMKDMAEKGMAKILEMLNQMNGQKSGKKVKIKSILTQGLAEDEILRIAKGYKPIVVIMGTRGKDRKESDLIGSVTAEVIELCKIPVLAIPEDFDYKGIDALKQILFITNFEEADIKVVDGIEKLIRPLDVSMYCVHVGPFRHSRWDEIKLAGMNEYLKKQYPYTTVKSDFINSEDFWLGVEAYVRNHNIDIICLGAKRRNIISRMLNPSIAKKMLFHTTTPLLVFPA